MVRPIICVDTILRWQPVNQRVLRTPDCTVHDKSRNRKLTHHSSRAHLGGLPPIRFYKGRSQEKTHLLRPEFFLLLSPLDRASSVLTYRAMCSVAGPCDPVNLVFSISGFHRLFSTKPVSSETNKAERWSNLATIVLFGTRGP